MVFFQIKQLLLTALQAITENVPWNWTKQHNSAFSAVKGLLPSNSVLIPFNEKFPIIVTCDASPYSIRSVLSHKLPHSREAPVAYASRMLTFAERNYS